MKMKMVKQPDPRTGCGVAVFAMLTKRDFDEALAYLLTKRGEWISRTSHHMTVGQMKSALQDHFGEDAAITRHRFDRQPWSAVYVIYQERWRHWLAWDGERFFDPLSPGGPTRTVRRKITRVVTTRAQSNP
ncbi:hypothetical protein [Stutzerimonas stutzeri]|uniref:hypothetical protein n=1 Tax=Stutzerimonas stutzeri TaxID=316 RepID=UPI000A5A79C3|nr:hypothetical protein [Stutzerimonas stutzeri]